VSTWTVKLSCEGCARERQGRLRLHARAHAKTERRKTKKANRRASFARAHKVIPSGIVIADVGSAARTLRLAGVQRALLLNLAWSSGRRWLVTANPQKNATEHGGEQGGGKAAKAAAKGAATGGRDRGRRFHRRTSAAPRFARPDKAPRAAPRVIASNFTHFYRLSSPAGSFSVPEGLRPGATSARPPPPPHPAPLGVVAGAGDSRPR